MSNYWDVIKIIEAVDLPLKNGTPRELEIRILYIQALAAEKPIQLKKQVENLLSQYDSIRYHMTELERVLNITGFFRRKQRMELLKNELFQEIDNEYPVLNPEIPPSHRVEMIINDSRPDGKVHEHIAEVFRDFFGVEPTYTFSELKGYPGPFWNFVRALRDMVGIHVTEASIRKAYQRGREETR